MNRYDKTKRVAVLGLSVNFVLMVMKLAVGFITKSQAMLADGFNSIGDMFTSAATYAGNKIASRPEDENHPYGHGKAEYIFSMIISFTLILVAYKIFNSSLKAILQNERLIFSWWLVFVAVSTIISKLCLFIYTRNAGRREDNLLIIANSEDHRNDVFVTLSTLIGIVLSARGIYKFDGIVGIAISIWIASTGMRIFAGSYNVLMDTNIDKKMKADFIKAIREVKGVNSVDEINSKPIGAGYIIIVKVSVNGEITVNEGHSIAARIKENLLNRKNVSDVIVHVNPLR